MSYTLVNTLQSILFIVLYICIEPLFILVWVDGLGYLEKVVKAKASKTKEQRLDDCIEILLAAGFMYVALRVNDNTFQLHRWGKLLYVIGILMIWSILWTIVTDKDSIVSLTIKYALSMFGLAGYGLNIYEATDVIEGLQNYKITIVIAILVIYVLIYYLFKNRYKLKKINEEMIK